MEEEEEVEGCVRGVSQAMSRQVGRRRKRQTRARLWRWAVSPVRYPPRSDLLIARGGREGGSGTPAPHPEAAFHPAVWDR